MEKTKMLFFGMLTAAGALVFELFVLVISPAASEIFLGKISLMVIFGVLIEEFFKLAIIWKIYNLAQNKNSIFVNSIFIGLGFFLMEFILSASQNKTFIELAGLPQYFGPFLVHLSAAAIFGYYFYRFKKSAIIGVFAFLSAIILHLAFNAAIIYGF